MYICIIMCIYIYLNNYVYICKIIYMHNYIYISAFIYFKFFVFVCPVQDMQAPGLLEILAGPSSIPVQLFTLRFDVTLCIQSVSSFLILDAREY